jgi:hypothetical protein
MFQTKHGFSHSFISFSLPSALSTMFFGFPNIPSMMLLPLTHRLVPAERIPFVIPLADFKRRCHQPQPLERPGQRVACQVDVAGR